MFNEPVYPYLPKDKSFSFVPKTHPMMAAAEEAAYQHSGCSWWQTGAVVVKNNTILGRGANTGQWQPLCPRYEKGCKTGEGYELCKTICKQTGHAEIIAIQDALKKNHTIKNAQLYLFGHWWCCENCWTTILEHNIQTVYLVENAHQLFTRQNREAVKKRIKEKIKQGDPIKKSEVFWQIPPELGANDIPYT